MNPPMKLQLKLEQLGRIGASEPNVDGAGLEPPQSFTPKDLQHFSTEKKRGGVLHEERTKAPRAFPCAGPELSARLQQCPGRSQGANQLTQPRELLERNRPRIF